MLGSSLCFERYTPDISNPSGAVIDVNCKLHFRRRPIQEAIEATVLTETIDIGAPYLQIMQVTGLFELRSFSWMNICGKTKSIESLEVRALGWMYI